MGIVAENGTVVTEAMLDTWVVDAEAGRLPGKPGPVRMGRPRTVGTTAPALPVTVRLSDSQRDKLDRLASVRHVSRAAVLRDLLDQAAYPA